MSTEEDEGLNSKAIDGEQPTFVAEVDATVFEAFLDSLTPIVDEARFRLHAGGITVRAVDAVNVACVESELALGPDVHPVDTAIGVRLADLKELFEGLPRSYNEDLTIEIGEGSLTLAAERADVRLDTIDESKLRDGPNDPLDEGMEFTTALDVDFASLGEFAEGLPPRTERVSLGESDGAFAATAETDSWTYERTFDAVGPDATAMFSQDCIRTVWGALPHYSGTIEFADGHPMRISYQDDQRDVTYYVAPRITEDSA